MATDLDRHEPNGQAPSADPPAPASWTVGPDQAAAMAPPSGWSEAGPTPVRVAPRHEAPPGQNRMSRLGDAVAAPFFSRRGQTVVVLSLVVLAVLVYLALSQLALAPASSSIAG